MLRLLPPLAVLVILTILSGAMHGNLRRRWGAGEEEQLAAARLAEFPKTLGAWETVHEGQLDETSLKMLEPSAYHVRVYKAQGVTTPISVTLLVGPPGYIGAHTPEVCVSGVGYEQLGPATKVTVPHPDRPDLESSFWLATFRSRGYDRHILREYWAWSTGGPWEASTGSRVGYGLFPYLYKIQLGCRLPAGSDPDTADPTADLLHQLVTHSPNFLLPSTK